MNCAVKPVNLGPLLNDNSLLLLLIPVINPDFLLNVTSLPPDESTSRVSCSTAVTLSFPGRIFLEMKSAGSVMFHDHVFISFPYWSTAVR